LLEILANDKKPWWCYSGTILSPPLKPI